MKELTGRVRQRAEARTSRLVLPVPGACFALALALGASSAAAQEARIPSPRDDEAEMRDAPGLGAHASRGFVAGALAGLGGSYLVIRDGGVVRAQGEWRALGLGLGVGALTGVGLGIALGAADGSGAPGGRYVARDMAWGAGFGTLAGGLGGGISAIARGDAERALHWAAIGALAGTSVGLLVGVIEGQARRERNVQRSARVHLAPSLAVASSLDGRQVVGIAPGVRGTF